MSHISIKKYIFAMVLAASVASCSQDFGYESVDESSAVINAYISNGTSRNGIDNRDDVYKVVWSANDKLAVFDEQSSELKPFQIIEGAGSDMGRFAGTETSGLVQAVYPRSIVKERQGSNIVIETAPVQLATQTAIFPNILPMYASGDRNSLVFYNVGAILKIQVKGKGILKEIRISSTDGRVMAGRGVLDTSDPTEPKIKFDSDGAREIILSCQGVVYDDNNVAQVYAFIPSGQYPGLKFSYETLDGVKATKEITQPVELRRSSIRAMSAISLESKEFKIPDERTNNMIWYETHEDTKAVVKYTKAFDVPYISDSYASGIGVMVFDGDVTEVKGQNYEHLVFENPENIKKLVLPTSLTYIGMYPWVGLGVETLEIPASVKTLGIDAFSQMKRIKELVLPEGLESIGLECFGLCTNLEHVTIPNSLKVVSAYAFLECSKLRKFYGENSLVSKDGYCLFENSSYGFVSDTREWIEIIAGADLVSYEIPKGVRGCQNYAFTACNKLETLVLSEEYTHFAFMDEGTLPKLKELYCKSLRPITTDEDSHGYMQSLERIYVPQESYDAYVEQSAWLTKYNHAQFIPYEF